MKAIEITSWSAGCRTVTAIKLLRESAGLRLDLAKELIEHVLAVETASFPLPSSADDRNLVSTLATLGFSSRVVGHLASVA